MTAGSKPAEKVVESLGPGMLCLADLYHERWEIETALDELKTHLDPDRLSSRIVIPEITFDIIR